MPVTGIDGALVDIISATDFIGKRVDAEVVGQARATAWPPEAWMSTKALVCGAQSVSR